ncbi:hypothetical protein EDD17DRAFT_1764827 [Pisolithus thermaeus]|nr:hypothetical protein EDD17DRAFT_1764827 [Pisolithus thermaeus]
MLIVNLVVGDLGPWAEGELCDEHEGMGSPEALDAMMETRSTHSQPQPASQLPMEYKMVFHPCSNWPLLFQSFEEFHVNAKMFTPPTDNTPYYPFQVAGDFKFMEVALAASLNQAQVDKLLDLISHVAQGMAQVTLKNNTELHKACDATAVQLMPIRDFDPHVALSFDHLHALHDGMGGRHALQVVKRFLSMLGCEAEAKVEAYISNFPRWHGLSHFKNALNVTFLDGNKKCNLAKEIFYACLDVLTKDKAPEGYCPLHVLASYLGLDSLIGLDVHMEKTIEMIKAELLRFSGALKGYIECVERSGLDGL